MKFLISVFILLVVLDFLLQWAFNIHLLRFLGKYTPYFLKGLWYIIKSIFKFIYWIFKSIFSALLSLGDEEIHSASFLENSDSDRHKLLNKSNSGLILEKNGRLSESISMQHTLILAPSGGGKTVSYIIPNVLTLDNASISVTDPSGEIFELTAKVKEKQGFKIKLFDLTDVSRSLKFNPLQRIESFSDIAKISSILIDSAFPDSNGSSVFWNDSAKLIISISLRMLKAQYGSSANLSMLYNHLNWFNTDKQEDLDILFSTNLDESSFQEYKAFMSQDMKVLSSVLSTAKSALSKLSDPDIAEITSSDTLNFEELRSTKCILYTIVNEVDINFHSFLITLLNTQLFNFTMLESRHFDTYLPIYILLDEFANTDKIPSFSTLITTLRKRKVSLSLVIQDYQQIYNLYGKMDGDTIISNANSKVYFAGLSLQTVRDIELSLGKVRRKIIDPNGYEKEEIQPLLHLDQIRMLPDDNAILLSKNSPPVILTLTPFFKNRKFKKMLNI